MDPELFKKSRSGTVIRVGQGDTCGKSRKAGEQRNELSLVVKLDLIH
jgi:hypothetical protein